METKAMDRKAVVPKQTDRRNNCLNLLRMLAAAQVFFGHIVPVFSTVQPSWLSPFMNALFLFEGVPFFFGISGFLLWMSIGRTDSFSSYLKNRVARLYPEMWGAILVNAAVTLILNFKNIKWFDFFAYQVAQGTFLQFWTPDSLRDFSNGPLWTVFVMAQCYIVLWFAYRFLHGKGLKRWIPTLAVCLAVNIFKPLLAGLLPAILYKLIWYTFVNHMWLFLVGAFLCEYFDRIIGWLKKLWWLAFLVEVLVVYIFRDLDIGSYPIIKSVSLLLGSIGLAYCLPKLNLKIDLSYGLYLYHMIVINAMVALGLFGGSFLWTLAALAISLLLAALSYISLGALSRKFKKNNSVKRKEAAS